MRLIGSIEGEQKAALFSDYLFVRGIENQVEQEGARFEVWVLADEQMEEAATLLHQFISNPAAPEYAKVSKLAREKEAQLEAEAAAAAERSFTSREVLQRDRHTQPYFTFLLLIASVLVAVLTGLGGETERIQPWVITQFEVVGNLIQWQPGLPEVSQGEVWRLITPIFLHFGVMHLVFNMLNLMTLGGMIERAMGFRFVLLFVLVTAVLSNLAEYGINLPPFSRPAPNFGGMSGVVFALFGFAWMKSKFDFASGIFVHPNTVAMIMVWYFICFTGILPIANMAHTVGLLIGLLWGWLSARRSLRR